MSERQPSLKARAEDLNKAFSDPSIRAIVCSIGGDDLIRVLPLLDVQKIITNPKCVIGFSDVISLHLLLWQLGIISYYGCNLLTQFAISGYRMHPFTVSSIRDALFTRSKKKLQASPEMQDGYLDWGDPRNLGTEVTMEKNDGWYWYRWSEEISTETRKKVQGWLHLYPLYPLVWGTLSA